LDQKFYVGSSSFQVDTLKACAAQIEKLRMREKSENKNYL